MNFTHRHSDDAADVAQEKERSQILAIHHSKHGKEMESFGENLLSNESKFTVNATSFFKAARSRGTVFVISVKFCGLHTQAQHERLHRLERQAKEQAPIDSEQERQAQRRLAT